MSIWAGNGWNYVQQAEKQKKEITKMPRQKVDGPIVLCLFHAKTYDKRQIWPRDLLVVLNMGSKQYNIRFNNQDMIIDITIDI